MINYTERISLLMEDIVARVPALSFIDMRRILVFARAGRTGTDGAYATCHCISLPPSEPGYYFWRDRTTGELTRRSEWFVTRSPEVLVDSHPIDYMISFTLPRFLDQSLSRSRKHVHYAGQTDWAGNWAGNWIAKLDTIVHELYHVDPARPGIRRMERADGTYSANCHGRRFFEDVVGMVKQYVASDPDPAVYEFLRHSFDELTATHGGIVGTTFRAFPSYPQRYTEVLDPQPAAAADMACRVEPLKVPRVTTKFSDSDLVIREFLQTSSRQVARKSQSRAA